MAQSIDEKRGYQRGYSRGGIRNHARVQRVVALARSYIARLSDTDTARVCETCDRWTRGGGKPNSDFCMWGTCRADFEWSLEPRMWVDHPIGVSRVDEQRTTITTQPKFGCVSWIPKIAS